MAENAIRLRRLKLKILPAGGTHHLGNLQRYSQMVRALTPMYSHPKAKAIQNNAHRRIDGLAIIPDFTALQSPSRIVIQTHDLYAVWRERSAETCAYPPPDYPRRKNYRVCCIDTQNPRGYKQLKLDKCPPRAGCYTPFGPPRTCAGAVESRLFRFYIPCIILLIGSY